MLGKRERKEDIKEESSASSKNSESSSNSFSDSKQSRTNDLSEEQKGQFDKFKISDETRKTLEKENIKYLFPIQVATFNSVYEGKDLIGKDRTGSGKTLAFALPVLERIRKKNKHFHMKSGQKPLILVLVPTRELAIQVTKEFLRFRNREDEYRVLSIYGGSDIYAQIAALK